MVHLLIISFSLGDLTLRKLNVQSQKAVSAYFTQVSGYCLFVFQSSIVDWHVLLAGVFYLH